MKINTEKIKVFFLIYINEKIAEQVETFNSIQFYLSSDKHT